MIEKAHWTGEGDNIRISMPLSKINEEQRRVSGFASLDNVDEHGDLVTAEATAEAFAAFRGNIREMHAPDLAVGRLVDFMEDVYYDEAKDEFYRGMYVTAYVSKGAQNTWEKVLDGTLSGFSIGGNVLEYDTVWDEKTQRKIRIITKYRLTELSLVDNPANQLANVLSIAKNADGQQVATGMLAEVDTRNIFYCVEDRVAKASKEENLDCAECSNPMVALGWYETTESTSEQDVIKSMVRKYLDTATHREGGAIEKMSDEKKNEVEVDEAVTEETVETEEAVVEPEAEETEQVEETEEVEEVEVPSELSKIIGDLQETVTKMLDESQKATKEQTEEVKKQLAEADKRLDEKVAELSKRIDEVQSRQDEITKSLAEIPGKVDEQVRKGLSELDEGTAIKKSADTDQPADEPVVRKGLWGGALVPQGGSFIAAQDL